MAAPDETNLATAANHTNRLGRLLRHEVGDLLQSVYSTVGILLERLPDTLTLERRLISDLKTRAELCKVELDAVVELVSPLSPRLDRVELTAVVQSALMQVRRRYPALPIHSDTGEPILVEADSRALAGSLSLLFLAVCQSAQRQVQVRISRDGPNAECLIERDGHATTPEQLGWLEQPFRTTQNALFGLALALVQRVAQAAGGEITAVNRPEGGIRIRLLLPATPV
jgi:C4-dicarboxylate-specific signal transduction histidine kinase